MKRPSRKNQHVISLRVSAEEWDSLHETMKGLKYKCVSDLMRAAFKLVQNGTVFGEAGIRGQKRTG